MLPQRKIAHKIADIIMSSTKRQLDPDRIKSLFVSSGTGLPLFPKDKVSDKFTDSISNIWIDSIVEHLSSRQSSLISDYILDIIDRIQSYLESSYTQEELSKICSLMEDDSVKKILSDNKLFDIVYVCKENFNSSVIATMQSEDCLNIMQKKLNNLMSAESYDDNNYWAE